jgi:hypothetical protein
MEVARLVPRLVFRRGIFGARDVKVQMLPQRELTAWQGYVALYSLQRLAQPSMNA